ncbi:hypothetical protein ACK8HX_05155 [Oryzobacter sp. R7]|uniref:hypothetical protein n=1 Tax=Oryzobacter faecalis TaxID=3388656 RepID=UPI00398D1B31
MTSEHARPDEEAEEPSSVAAGGSEADSLRVPTSESPGALVTPVPETELMPRGVSRAQSLILSAALSKAWANAVPDTSRVLRSFTQAQSSILSASDWATAVPDTSRILRSITQAQSSILSAPVWATAVPDTSRILRSITQAQSSIVSPSIAQTWAGALPDISGYLAQISGVNLTGLSAAIETFRQATANLPVYTTAGLARGMEQLLEAIRSSRLPSNLRSLSTITSDDVVEFTIEHGVSLYLVPRPSIAKRLLDAKDGAAVRRILGERRCDIATDCRAVLAGCDELEVLKYRELALQALDAFDADLYAPAQALAANILDAILSSKLPVDVRVTAKRRVGESVTDFTKRLDDLSGWEGYVAAAMWSTHQHYFTANGDVVPHAFSRHATTHAAGSRQYSRRSAIQALMAVTSAIGYVNGLS